MKIEREVILDTRIQSVTREREWERYDICNKLVKWYEQKDIEKIRSWMSVEKNKSVQI